MTVRLDPQLIRNRIRTFKNPVAYRVIPVWHAHQPLKAKPSPSRFCDGKSGYSVLYAAESIRTAAWEALFRDRFVGKTWRALGRSEASARMVVSVNFTRYLDLVDLHHDGPVRIAAPTAVVHDTNYASGRALGRATRAQVPQADGFAYASRFTGETCFAVFDRALGALWNLSLTPLDKHPDFFRTLNDYGIRLES